MTRVEARSRLDRRASSQRFVHSIPAGWKESWGEPSPFLRKQLRQLQISSTALAAEIPSTAKHDELGPLVGSRDLRDHPVHRWYHYKEAFSPALPRIVHRDLGGPPGSAADVFGGVATTALALSGTPCVDSVISIEYSPFAVFAGATKIGWPWLQPARLRRLADALIRFEVDRTLPAPTLAAFANCEIFDESTLSSLLSAREAIRAADLRSRERDFFLLGLAGVVEAASGAMKDGRALRILRGRNRSVSSLTPFDPSPPTGDKVRDLLRYQWAAMIEDLDRLSRHRAPTKRIDVQHLHGDARDLGQIMRSPRRPAFGESSIAWSCFSPPYLNCIDYSEVYKLELWLLEFVTTRDEFRSLRLGTLRSHPSVDFPPRGYLAGISSEAAELVSEIVSFMERHGSRPSEARMVGSYFDDMYRVLSQQHWALEPGGAFACVVGNSTFSRRVKSDSEPRELWRLPVLTDVLLAHLARTVGFENVELWTARELRPRNVRGGTSRESVVVGWKPR